MWLTIHSGRDSGTAVEITGERFVVGRQEGCELVLADEKASRQHAAFEALPDGRVIVRDLGSTNGTLVDGRRIEQPTLLSGGEQLQIGDTVLDLSDAASAAAPTTVGPDAGTVEEATAAATPPPSVPAATPSRIERIMLRRSVRRAQILAAVAGGGVVIAVIVVVLFVTGVFGGAEEKPTVPEIIEAITPSTMEIRGNIGGESTGLGTGWVLDADAGLIVTNAHVVNEATEFTVRLGNEQRERPAELLGVAPCDDLAVLRAEDTAGLVTLPLGSQADLKQGDEVVALGYPVSLSVNDELIATEGVVSVVKTRATLGDGSEYPNAIQTDAVINPGNSGGPLVDLGTELVGVNTFKTVRPGFEGQFYAIGVDRVKEIVPRLSEGHSIAWVGMGFFYPQQESDLTDIGLPAVVGLVIARAVRGTSAAEAGLGQAPALLVGIDGKPIDTTLGSYCKAVGSLEEGASATFTVIVAGSAEAQDVSLTFE